MKNKKIVLIAGDGPTTNIVYNYLSTMYTIDTVILEEPKSFSVAIKGRWKFIKRRIKRLGLNTVIGQILFSLFIQRRCEKNSQRRIKEILDKSNLSLVPISVDKINFVKSHNSQQTVEVLKALNPDVVVVNGTCILKEHILDAVPCAFINTHAGITPKYRGVHGMYWALANDDAENAGVTVHFVDKGIDTGKVIYQAITKATSKDNFSTYLNLQIAEGVKILSKAISDYLNGCVQEFTPPKESKLYYHPTLWQYLKVRRKLGKNIKVERAENFESSRLH